jgi:hypothetical protein
MVKNLSEKLSAAKTAIKSGDKPTGTRLLAEVLKDGPYKVLLECG